MNKVSSDSWKYFWQKGVSFYSEKNYFASIDAFNQSIALKEYWDTYRLLGEAYLLANRITEAIDAFNKSIELEEHWDSYLGLAKAYLVKLNYASAIEAFNKSIALNKSPATYRGLGKALSLTKHFQAAIDAFKKSIDLEQHWDSYLGLGKAFLSRKKYSEAIDAFNKSIELQENWDSYLGLGEALFYTNNYSTAINCFNRSIALKSHWKAHQGLGWSQLYSKDYPAAINAFTNSIAHHEHWNSYRGLGEALFHIKKYPTAINAFNKSIALHEHWNSYQGLGWSLLRHNDFAQAIAVFNKSISLSEHWNAYRGLGNAFLHINEYRQALDAINNCYSINPSKEIEKQFCDIFSQSNSDVSNHKTLIPFFDCIISGEKDLAEACLVKYILCSSKSLSIDTLILRHASLLMRDRDKVADKSVETEFILKAIESNVSEHESPNEISGLHRYVFGVSHSRIHFASPNTTVIECGAGTMYSIGSPESRTRHFQHINSALETINPENSVLIFEFGEVDIRNHVFKIAKRQNCSIRSVADLSVSRYIEFISSLKKRGYKIVIGGPHCGGGDSPSRTTAVERNDLCGYVNNILMRECSSRQLFFYTLFDVVVDQDLLTEIPGLYSDGFHLNLPPSKTGIALNSLVNCRINRTLSMVESQYQPFQPEVVSAQCILVASNIPGWRAGVAFYPGKEIVSGGVYFGIGEYLLLIELPFLLQPQEVALGFMHPVNGIKTSIQGVLESWDISKEIDSNNIINSSLGPRHDLSLEADASHLFSARSVDDRMCRFLIINISTTLESNHLARIGIKRQVF